MPWNLCCDPREGLLLSNCFQCLPTAETGEDQADRYRTRDQVRRDVFEYIELFSNPIREHMNSVMLSPVDFENRQRKLKKAGVQETRSTSLIYPS
ncbi:IS3 family transposase [Roseovarius rhodophyticola]|uniref:IS3 family transposase n=1 Tax=Roseovarius rhodophyticola TaxID=3080827 RepID=UPI003BAE8FAE